MLAATAKCIEALGGTLTIRNIDHSRGGQARAARKERAQAMA